MSNLQYSNKDPLHTSVQYVKGVGPHLASMLANRGIYTVFDLINHFPARYIDRRRIDSIRDASPGPDRTIIAEVVTSGIGYLGKKRSRIFEVIAKDETGIISAKWFHFHPKFMTGRFKKGARVLFAGDMTEYNGIKQFVHPETEVLGDEDSPELGGKLLPIYPSTEGISQRMFRKIIRNAWDKYSPEIRDSFSEDFIKKNNLMGLKSAAEFLHIPPNETDVDLLNSFRSAAHRTIIFTEFFFLELALAMKRARLAAEDGISFKFDQAIHEKFLAALPFTLTDAQSKSISQIIADMSRPHPMLRLLQGDVGSGKTVVGLACALQAVANGYQTAFMAPTEILAEQHYNTISKLLENMRIPCALLTASIKGGLRESIYKGVKDGSIPILIGTHAVIQEDVSFAKLGLAIIDEQHRFGVLQRQALQKKGTNPDILVMTATPIPRTLAMTLYGDLEVSILDQLPAGRKPIVTKIYRDKDREKLYHGMSIELEKGHQAYLVYPLIEESEKVDLKNATEMAEQLKLVFSPKYRVELLHGRMKSDEKETIMRDFKEGRVNILAATSVVEVGVDVPNATVMVIEHAERFGLSQLHQLRGRVGRGNDQSFCILMCGAPPSEEGRLRLNIMVETGDGFRIAEEDLAIRGPGEFLGTRQSGLPEFKLADLMRDSGILQIARQTAFEIVTEDPRLELPKNRRFAEEIKQKGRLELSKVA